MNLPGYTASDAAEAWARLKSARPLVLHVTNAVGTALQANVCLAVGASPIMSQFPDETEELIALAGGFLVNLGTPTAAGLEAVKRGLPAAARNAEKGKGCVTLLDPVGYGASRFRTESTGGLLRDYRFSIIKGNAGEMSLLAGLGGATRGVDSLPGGDPSGSVREIARRYKCVACATGKADYISDGETVLQVTGGSDMLPFLSGSGCAAGTVVLSAAAACGDPALGTLTGLLAMGVASERAEKKCGGVGTFPPHLIDELHRLTPEDFYALNESQTRWSVV